MSIHWTTFIQLNSHWKTFIQMIIHWTAFVQLNSHWSSFFKMNSFCPNGFFSKYTPVYPPPPHSSQTSFPFTNSTLLFSFPFAAKKKQSFIFIFCYHERDFEENYFLCVIFFVKLESESSRWLAKSISDSKCDSLWFTSFFLFFDVIDKKINKTRIIEDTKNETKWEKIIWHTKFKRTRFLKTKRKFWFFGRRRGFEEFFEFLDFLKFRFFVDFVSF